MAGCTSARALHVSARRVERYEKADRCWTHHSAHKSRLWAGQGYAPAVPAPLGACLLWDEITLSRRLSHSINAQMPHSQSNAVRKSSAVASANLWTPGVTPKTWRHESSPRATMHHWRPCAGAQTPAATAPSPSPAAHLRYPRTCCRRAGASSALNQKPRLSQMQLAIQPCKHRSQRVTCRTGLERARCESPAVSASDGTSAQAKCRPPGPASSSSHIHIRTCPSGEPAARYLP